MVALKCENCGGRLERNESDVFVSENIVIVRAGCGFECQHCGSRFEPGTTHEKVGGSNTQIAIGNNIAQAGSGGIAIVQRGSGAVAVGGGVAAGRGSIAIGGNVCGDIVVGDKCATIDWR